MDDEIAIVGVGLRFPGDATSPEELWQVLERGESQWSEIPRDRLNIDGYYHPSGDRQGSISFRGGHFLPGNVGAFDAPFFSVAAEDAKAVDPQQRLLLEVCYEAVENAGLRKEDLDGTDTAVYVGSFVKDYEQICLRDPDWQPQYAATGNGIAIMANRISYFFNLHGPSMTLDTGCSGSLVSVHLAAQSLRTGESSLAIAAGAGMILTPNTIMPMTALNFLSPDGKCFTFDSRANGYGRGEGVGVVILKRLSDAVRDNDTIRAVIRGSGVNQDGRTTGITLPSKEAQVANMRSIYKDSGLDFDQTAYVECHGTGTQAGDWRELKAISETLGSTRSSDQPIVVGSIKPNIGHLEGAAGVAGLIKGVLMLERGKIPPNINFQSGNPDIDFENWKVKVPTGVLQWPLPGVRRLSVNCFGFGGTNAHVIMDEAPVPSSQRSELNHISGKLSPAVGEVCSQKERNYSQGGGIEQAEPRLFCYSSHERGGVKRIMSSHVTYLEGKQEGQSPEFLSNYSYTLGCRRSNLEWKGALVASSVTELIARIRDFDQTAAYRSSKPKRPKFGLVFCGQGSQLAQMGKDLMSFEVFSQSFEEASHHLKTACFSSFDLLQEVFKPDGVSRINDPEVAQPAVTALQVALVDLLESIDIFSSHVVGHSSGEIAAAYAAGGLSRQAAWEVAYFRGLAAASIPIVAPKLVGGMAVVGMSLRETEHYLIAAGLSVQVACVNSPRSVTISGQADSIEKIAEDLRGRKVFCRVLNVKTAYHSSHMKLVEVDYERSLGGMGCREFASAVRMFSSVTGRMITGSELNNVYWAKNMVSPVQYVAAIESMMSLPANERPEAIIEISPKMTLRSPTLDILAEMEPKSQVPYFSVLDSMTHGVESVLRIAGDLWRRGYSINMNNVVAQGKQTAPLRSLSDLPPYAWNHEKAYWHESHLGRANRFREYPRQDLIGAPTADSIPFEPRWRGFLRISENPWIQDHQVQRAIVYPAAGMVSMVLEGASQIAKNSTDLLGYEITEMRIEKAMVVPNSAHGLEVALNIKDTDDGIDSNRRGSNLQEFSIYSKGLDRPWERHTVGGLRIRYKHGDHDVAYRSHEARHAVLETSCTESYTPRQLYELLDTVGMNYGPLFQNITEIRTGGDSCVGKIRVPDTKSKMPAKFEYPHLIHPATLDSMFQTLFSIEPIPMVPTFIRSLFVSTDIGGQVGAQFTGHATARRVGIQDAEASISMRLSGLSQSYVSIDGLHLTGLSTTPAGQGGFLPNHRNLCTEITWEEDAALAQPSEFFEQVSQLAHKFPRLSILQVGGGFPLARTTLLAVAPDFDKTPRLSRYTIDDSKDAFSDVLAFTNNTPLEPFLEQKSVGTSESLATYNLIIVFDDSRDNVDLLKKHLRSEGVLLKKARLSMNGGPVAAETNGLEVSNAFVSGAAGSGSHLKFISDGDDQATMLEVYRDQQIPAIHASSSSMVALLLPTLPGTEVLGLVASMERLARESQPKIKFLLVRGDEVGACIPFVEGKIVISLLDFAVGEALDQSVYGWRQGDFDAFHALQKSAKGIVWVTRGAHMNPHNPKGAPVIALGRTLISEDPLKSFVTLDLDIKTHLDELVARNLTSVLHRAFFMKGGPSPRETEYAEKGGKLYIPRLRTVTTLNNLIENANHNQGIVEKSFHSHALASAPTASFELTISKPGLAEGGFYFVETALPELDSKEIEVAFDQAHLSHLDVDTVMGRTIDSTIGLDVKGRVKRVGSYVAGLEPGDTVVALVPGGALKDTIHVDGRFVKRAEGSMPPSVAVSAYYGLVGIGRVGPGRKVLVHAGASNFGLAAVELALFLGAGVFATVLGAQCLEQSEVLRSLGVTNDHILNADSESFVSGIELLTSGKGVDVVYNPTQEHLEANFKCVRKCGSIVQFAHRWPSPRAFRTPAGSVAFVNFDLRQLLEEDPGLVAELFDASWEFLQSYRERNSSTVGPGTDYKLHDIKAALRHVEGNPYLGRVSVSVSIDGSDSLPVLEKNITKPLHEALDSDGTYLLAGGLGGLGRSIAELLVRHGVRHLAFLSRSGASSDQVKAFIENLSRKGIDARVYCVDICDEHALEQAVQHQVTAQMPPIRGVFQCAGIIKDAVFDNMTYSDWEAAFRPKTVGSWNLVQKVPSAGCDPFFIFLASSAGVIGNRGQANYAAGNCFEDALARCLRLQGKHAVSLDLGPVLGAGMLAEDEEILNILRASGFYGIRHEDFLKVVHHAITMETAPGRSMPPQVTLGVGTGGLILQNQPADPYWSRTALYSYLNLVDMPPPDLSATESDSGGSDVRTQLACCGDVAAAAEVVCGGLAGMLAKAMNMLPEEVDAGKPASAYGVDSLVAVGVRNWVLGRCGVQVSVFEVLSDSTVAELAVTIAERGGFGGGEKA